MTSLFARNRRLGRQTLEAYHRLNTSQNVNNRLDFFMNYLQDVAPSGLIIEHVPVEPDERGRPTVRDPAREEIQLSTLAGDLFMSGLVSLEYNPRDLERTAGDEAYTKWLHSEFTADGDNWRFFTGQSTIKFFDSQKDEWYVAGEFHPIEEAEEVAAFLQEEFDKLYLNVDDML